MSRYEDKEKAVYAQTSICGGSSQKKDINHYAATPWSFSGEAETQPRLDSISASPLFSG